MPLSLTINGVQHELEVDPSTPLLWVLRDHLNMTGTKFGCGIALCGVCTVQLDGKPIRSCVTPLARVADKQVRTIEGLGAEQLSPLQQAWLEEDVSQCGYCQSGQLMAADALLATNPNPSDDDIDQAMAGILCRCGTYPRIRKAIKQAAVQYYPAEAKS